MSAPGNIATGQVQLSSTSATQIVAARTERVRLYLKLRPDVFIGPTGVNLSTGFEPPLDESGVFEMESAAAVFGIASVGSPTIEFLEIFT